MSQAKSSRWWPYLKRLAQLLSVPVDVLHPGTGVAVRFLTDLQDDLDRKNSETKAAVNEALSQIRSDPADLSRTLENEGLPVSEEQLRRAAREVAEALYLWQVARDYVYADFKGIEQQERVASLKLDEIFVDLKAVPEAVSGSSRWIEKGEFPFLSRAETARLIYSDEPIFLVGNPGVGKSNLVAEFAKAMSRKLGPEEIESVKDSKATPQSIDEILSHPGGFVLLGGPGSGKTTLVKRLARSCALGADELQQRYPRMPWSFPVVLPISTFQTERQQRDIYRFLLDRLQDIGGDVLREAFIERWAAGECLILLDGLDEVADAADRIRAARAVDDLLDTAAGNRVVLTTRVVGYNITRLSVPAGHFLLEPFSPAEIATFIRQWYAAYDRALHPDHPDTAQAERDAESLLEDVQKNPGVATLANNPLMLTIIALIKHTNVVLPERRVELYEIALNTLLRSWNRARSLAKVVPAGEEPQLPKTRKLWAAVAYWMHSHVSRTISEAQLHEQLVRVLTEEFREPAHQADDIASSYLAAAKERSGLLEARGPTTFAFVHQTFQEYLAAIHLAIPGHKAVEKIRKHVHDPRWHEAIRLAAGYIAIHQTDFDTLADLLQALLNDSDPLEPYLATSLRLALACLSDDIGVPKDLSDQVLVKVFDHMTGGCYEPLKDSLLTTLRTLKTVPGAGVIERLCEMTEDQDWQVRTEATRLLARLSLLEGPALKALDEVFGRSKEFITVKAQAAWGLWLSRRRDPAIIRELMYGLMNSTFRQQIGPQSALVNELLEFLADDDAQVRYSAANVLGNWGFRQQAMPVLRAFVNDKDSQFRHHVAELLGDWGHQAEAVPILLDSLQHVDHYVGYYAAKALGRWGHQEEVANALFKLLTDANAHLRYRAAILLGNYGHLDRAVPVLIELLQGSDIDIRLRVLVEFANWESQREAVPVVVGLLKNSEGMIQAAAAKTLGAWQHRELALPILLELLKDHEGFIATDAAKTVSDWGNDITVVRAVTKKIYRTKRDAEVVVQFLTESAKDRNNARSAEINALLVKGLNPGKRDSNERRQLRRILFRWTWDKVAATA